MAHRKHLSQEGHAEPEKKQVKKAEKKQEQTPHKAGNNAQAGKFGKPNEGYTKKEDRSNPHIKDEHGEY